MKSQTRALVRHISPFGNPIKEDNPFSLLLQQFFASSPSSRRNLIFRKKKKKPPAPRRFTRRVDLRATTDGAISRMSRARHDRRIFSSSILPSTSSSSSIPRWFPFDPSALFHLGFPPIISTFVHGTAPRCRHLTIFLREYVTRRSFGNINRRLRPICEANISISWLLYSFPIFEYADLMQINCNFSLLRWSF